MGITSVNNGVQVLEVMRFLFRLYFLASLLTRYPNLSYIMKVLRYTVQDTSGKENHHRKLEQHLQLLSEENSDSIKEKYWHTSR